MQIALVGWWGKCSKRKLEMPKTLSNAIVSPGQFEQLNSSNTKMEPLNNRGFIACRTSWVGLYKSISKIAKPIARAGFLFSHSYIVSETSPLIRNVFLMCLSGFDDSILSKIDDSYFSYPWSVE